MSVFSALTVTIPASPGHFWFERDVAEMVGKEVTVTLGKTSYTGKVNYSRPAGDIDSVLHQCTHIEVQLAHVNVITEGDST